MCRLVNSIISASNASWFIEAIHRSKPSCGNGAVPDVVPIVHAVETDAFHDFVGAPLRYLDRVTQGRHAQHASAIGDDGAIFQGRTRVKHPEVFSRRGESRYDVASFRGVGVTGGSENHPERGAAVPFRLDAPMPPVLGPRSPSPRRLWSWLVARGSACSPSTSTMKLASSPSRNSSITTRLPAVPIVCSTRNCSIAR